MCRRTRSGDAARSIERNEVEQMKSVMRMKMFRAAAVLLCGAGLVVSAAVAQQDSAPPPPPDGQQQGPPMAMHGRRGMDPERRAEMMQRRLGLNADQTAQVKAIMTDGQAKMEALRANTSLAPEDRRAQGMAMHEDMQAKIRAVLTPDQEKEFDAMQARMRGRRGRMGGDGPPPPPPPAEAPQS